MEKLGETFDWEGHTLKVSEVEDLERPCVGCFFFGGGYRCYHGVVVPCTNEDREDHTDVIFKEQLKTEK